MARRRRRSEPRRGLPRCRRSERGEVVAKRRADDLGVCGREACEVLVVHVGLPTVEEDGNGEGDDGTQSGDQPGLGRARRAGAGWDEARAQAEVDQDEQQRCPSLQGGPRACDRPLPGGGLQIDADEQYHLCGDGVDDGARPETKVPYSPVLGPSARARPVRNTSKISASGCS